MRRFAAIAALLLAACGGSGDAPPPEAKAQAGNAAPASVQPKAAPAASSTHKSAAARWTLQARGEGSSLALVSVTGATTMRLFCPAGGGRLLVNVPGFRPIGSEERLSFGSGGNVTALVADTRGDRLRGGVSGTGAVPGDFGALIAGPVSASYGAQVSGPHPAPARELASAFVGACRKGAAPAKAEVAGASPCNTQGGGRLAVRPLRAVGTEPFWGARIDGRCVTYSHPDDQEGTRIWTRHTPGAGRSGTWVGAYQGKPFELRIRAAPGCSDGMSDTRYPLAADLLVNGEKRQGCAAPL
jgi:uncharacterized membrane protein